MTTPSLTQDDVVRRERCDVNPLEVTEWLLRQPPPVSRGLVVNMPARGISFHGRLFQASMWREYAMTWHGRRTRTGVDQRWCEVIGRMTYEDCLRRARVNVYLARRLNRALAQQPAKEPR